MHLKGHFSCLACSCEGDDCLRHAFSDSCAVCALYNPWGGLFLLSVQLFPSPQVVHATHNAWESLTHRENQHHCLDMKVPSPSWETFCQVEVVLCWRWISFVGISVYIHERRGPGKALDTNMWDGKKLGWRLLLPHLRALPCFWQSEGREDVSSYCCQPSLLNMCSVAANVTS